MPPHPRAPPCRRPRHRAPARRGGPPPPPERRSRAPPARGSDSRSPRRRRPPRALGSWPRRCRASRRPRTPVCSGCDLARGPDPERAEPVRLPEHEGDVVAELHELGLAVVLVEPPPQILVGPVRVVGHRVCPLERRPLPLRELREVRHARVVDEIASAELLYAAVDDAVLEHRRPRLRVAVEGRREARPDGVGAGDRGDAAHGASPAALRFRTSPCPMPSVLIQRCCPKVRPTKYPSSMICSSVKCSRSRAQTASSAPSGFQTNMLV